MDHKNIRGTSLHAPSNEIVENNTGVAIARMKVVAIDGMGTLFPQISLANPNVKTNFGIAQADILDSKVGYVTCFGFMFNQNTSAWGVGVELYSDNAGNLSPTPNGGVVAIVVKSHTTAGVLYVTAIADLAGGGGNPSWELNGNNGLDEAVNFLGTGDAVDFRIRTNNVFRANFTKNGRLGIGEVAPDEFIHIKAHTGFAGSGSRVTTFAVTTSDTNWNQIYSWAIPDKASALVSVQVVGRTQSGQRAAFKRTVTFSRDGITGIIGRQQSDYTDRTSDQYDIRWRRVNEVLFVEVKSATVNDTDWTGSAHIDVTVETP